MSTVIRVENLSKQYRLGSVGRKTLYEDLIRWYFNLLKKEDPFIKITEHNLPDKTANSNFIWALQHIDFELSKGEVLGIIGKNGAGKSTLLKILSKVTAPTRGIVKIKGKIGSLLEVGTGFHPELSGKDNIFLNGSILGMSKKEIKKKLDEIIEFSGVERYINTPVKRYSSGMYVRLAFAIAAHLEPDILIVDEVLAVGDAEFQQKCLGKLKEVSEKEGRTVLFVSHNLKAVQHLCDRAILINKGLLEMDGAPSDIISCYLKDRGNRMESYRGEGPIKTAAIFISASRSIYPSAKMEISFTTEYPIRSLTLGINIKDEMDVCLIGVNNKHYLNEVLNKQNKTVGKIIVDFPELRLLPGTYYVDLFLTNAIRPFEIVRNAFSFIIPYKPITATSIAFDRKINKIFMEDVKWELI